MLRAPEAQDGDPATRAGRELPAAFRPLPWHDHAADGQEEVHTALSGTIYRKPTALMFRVREEKGKPPLIHVARLPADEPANRPNSARSEPWQLPTPGHRLKWRLLFDDDQLHRSSILHVSRLGTVTPSLTSKASIPHVGEVGLFEIGLEVVASVDPTVELTVMTPWGREGEDLRELLYEVAADAVDEEDDPGELTEALGNYLRPHLPGQPPPGWEFSLPRSRLQLAEGQRDQVALRLRAPTPPVAGSPVSLSGVSFGMARLDVHRRGVGLARGVNGWLRFRAWSYSNASPIGWVSS
jgi:hypothetical protein